MADGDQNIPLGIQGHRAESERLARLADFLSRFAPSSGEARSTGRPVDDATDPAILAARSDAVVESFRAVARLARISFVEPTEP